MNGKRVGFHDPATWFCLTVVRIFLFPAWRRKIGGQLHFILCGGAALDPKWLRIAFACSIPVYEGYGITEAGPLVSYNSRKALRKGSVGRPMRGVEVRIAADDEVLVKSEGVMSGYFKNQEETRNVCTEDGWLHTGDLGRLDTDGFLILTGVKKTIFKLASGLYVNPEYIEGRLKQFPVISEAFVYGHNRNFLVAILNIRDEISLQELPETSIQSKLEMEIRSYNSQSRGPDQVQNYRIVSDEWTRENGMLKNDLALHRNNLLLKYKSLIEEMYSGLFP
jgi:long-chain acyl-CoA synthetase